MRRYIFLVFKCLSKLYQHIVIKYSGFFAKFSLLTINNMKSEEIQDLFLKFERAAAILEGVECWSARELQLLLGYTKWENFEKVII